MEHNDQKPESFDFLSNPDVAAVFADLNLKLLSGRHILSEDFRSFGILDRFGKELAHYYHTLYNLKLDHDKKDDEVYYFLDFFESGKGSMADPSRHKLLTEWQTVVGIVLLNLYYSQLFQQSKLVNWPEIQREIMDGELKDLYRSVFFSEVSHAHSPKDLQLQKSWKDTIKSFEDFGWVKMVSNEKDNWAFEIKPSIHRLEKLYADELNNFEDFIQRVTLRKLQHELPTNQ